MLYGRHEERRIIHALLANARQGHSGVLVIHGQAGIGKHALLQHAQSQATDFHLLRGSGVESETHLAFAALQQLLRPILGWLDRLPDPEANALQGAFGLIDAHPDPLLTKLGLLSLLSQAAKDHPVLCLVDHAHHLDQPSADALVFAARRLPAEPIVLLLAARDDLPHHLDAPDLPSLRLGGLDPNAAGQLLHAHTATLTSHVRDRLINETAGNPLALLELTASLTTQQLAGHQPLPQRLPLTDRLQHCLLEQVHQLPKATRTLLLVAAVEDTGELAAILAASRLLAADPQTLQPARRSGLIQINGPQLQFRHPLLRSAIYQQATFLARRAAHRALAEVLDGERQADRRAWHLAAATLGPDEQAARALEATAERARRRGNPTTAATALQQAATLTPATGPRARRLIAAAESLWQAGHGDRAQTLLDSIQPQPADPHLLARIAHLRGAVELATGTPATACTLLIEAAKPILTSDPDQATEMLVMATRAALAANDPQRIIQVIAPTAPPTHNHHDTRIKRIAQSLLATQTSQPPPIERPPTEPPPTTWPHPWLTWAWPMLLATPSADSNRTARQHYTKLATAARNSGNITTLTVALANLAIADYCLGQWPNAISNATQALRLASKTGQHATTAYLMTLLASIAAQQGRAQDCQQLAQAALAIATPRRLPAVTTLASQALAQLDLANARPTAALERLLALTTPHHPMTLLATGDLIEAAARTGRLQGMQPLLANFQQCAQADKQTWTLATAARCQALLTHDDTAEQHYQTALATNGTGLPPFDQARTELLYGEWLRRARRRADARPHLQAALDTFHHLGATPWTHRATVELRASGETARKRDLTTLKQLTPQELQIARLAADGLTNRQIAAGLYLSPYTVGYHLHKIYAKLDITSRASLRHHNLDNGDKR